MSTWLDLPFAHEVGAEVGGEISAIEMTRFRALTATANYIVADRLDTQFMVKQISCEMAAPTKSRVARVKRLARCLAEYSRLVWDFGRRAREREGAICFS